MVFGASEVSESPSRPLRKLWTALHALDGYLTGPSNWTVNYGPAPQCRLAGWHRDHRRDGQFPGEPRMNKSQQMRWSRRGADLLLQVRCAVYNGTLIMATDEFYPANDP